LLRLKGVQSAVIGFERWASEADHERHLEGAHFQMLAQRLAEIVAEPPNIVSYEVLDE
jgi:quinol monooxygenase YgiN